MRFNAPSALLSNSLGLGSGASFGNYSGLLSNPRMLQFALRYDAQVTDQGLAAIAVLDNE